MEAQKTSVGSKLCLAFITALLLVPMVMLIAQALQPVSENGGHVVSHLLTHYSLTSLNVALSVVVITVIIGSVSAWLIACFDFPGRAFFSFAILLPLAIPAYIAAFIYAGVFDYAGPVQDFIRSHYGLAKGEYYFPEIRSHYGAIFSLSLVFYPYVYLLVYLGLKQSAKNIVVARSFGKKGINLWYQICIKMLRPAWVGGGALVAMEVLADYGAVDYLAVDTLTVGIFKSWYSFNDPALAARLALGLLVCVMVVLAVERLLRGGRDFKQWSHSDELIRTKLGGVQALVASLLLGALVILAFILPVYQLFMWSSYSVEQIGVDAIYQPLINSLQVSAYAASIATLIAFFITSIMRNGVKGWPLVATFGYAVPGSVAALGCFLMLVGIDRLLNEWVGNQIGLLLSGSFIALIYVYVFRFIAVSHHTLDTAYQKIPKTHDWIASTLGASRLAIALKLHMPMLSLSFISAWFFVFIESMKELPATMMIRPFNYETLATTTYQLASDERLYDAATPALVVVILGVCAMLCVYVSLFNRGSK